MCFLGAIPGGSGGPKDVIPCYCVTFVRRQELDKKRNRRLPPFVDVAPVGAESGRHYLHTVTVSTVIFVTTDPRLVAVCIKLDGKSPLKLPNWSKLCLPVFSNHSHPSDPTDTD